MAEVQFVCKGMGCALCAVMPHGPEMTLLTDKIPDDVSTVRDGVLIFDALVSPPPIHLKE